MKKFLKKYIIKIPKDISIFYCNNKKIITIFGKFGYKSLILKTKIFILTKKKYIQVTKIPFFDISRNQKKKLNSIQGTTVALIKQIILEISVLLYNKLKFIGVGYRIFPIEIFKNQLLHFKLGYSHQIYFKISKKLNFFCLKSINLFIFGNSFQFINQTGALIKSYKYPEPYKGKGILYENEKINLKEGKKI